MTFIMYGVIGIVVMIVVFFAGLILFVRGLLKKPLAEYAGSKTPKVMMMTGVVLLLMPVVCFVSLTLWSITSSVTTMYNRAHYKCIPDIWRHESVDASRAESDILKALLTSADKGSREAFARNFTPEIQRRKGFDKAVDKFFESYPAGLSDCDKTDQTFTGTEASESKVLTDSVRFRCRLADEWYFVTVAYCYANPKEPDKVGVTEFRVMNLGAAAMYDCDPDGGGKEYLVCDIKDSGAVNARLIGGQPYLWNTDEKAVITSDQLRTLLRDHERLDDPVLSLALGECGLGIKNSDSTEYGYFYELADKGIEPVYVYFQTDSEYGQILWSYLCTPEKIDYDKPIVEYKSGS